MMRNNLLDTDFILREGVFFLLKNMELSQSDNHLLEKWGFELPIKDVMEKEDTLSQNKINVKSLKENFTQFSNFESHFFILKKKIIADLQKKQFTPIDTSEIIDSLILFYQNHLKDFLLYLGLTKDNTIENLTFLTVCYSNLLAQKTDASKNLLENLLLGSILSDLYFYFKDPKKIKLELIKNIEQIDNINFLKQHTIYAYQFLKEVKDLPEKYKRFGLLHHEKIDGSGYHGLKGNKIPVEMLYLSMIQDFIYPYHPFLNQFREQKDFSFTSIELLKRNKQYPQHLLKSFVEVFGIYVPGEVILLKNQSSKWYGIIYSNQGIDEKPLVKSILNENYEFDSSLDLTNLQKDSYYTLSTLNNEKIIKKIKQIFIDKVNSNKFV